MVVETVKGNFQEANLQLKTIHTWEDFRKWGTGTVQEPLCCSGRGWTPAPRLPDTHTAGQADLKAGAVVGDFL